MQDGWPKGGVRVIGKHWILAEGEWHSNWA